MQLERTRETQIGRIVDAVIANLGGTQFEANVTNLHRLVECDPTASRKLPLGRWIGDAHATKASIALADLKVAEAARPDRCGHATHTVSSSSLVVCMARCRKKIDSVRWNARGASGTSPASRSASSEDGLGSVDLTGPASASLVGFVCFEAPSSSLSSPPSDKAPSSDPLPSRLR